MKNKELMIGIPTKNHPKYMQYYLAKTLVAAKKYGIDICIYDSSDDDSTKRIVENRIKKGYDNLFYYHFDPSIPPEVKMKRVLVESDYDYVWLCGDGIVLDIEKTISVIEKEIQKKRDVIVFSFFDTYGPYNEYTDPLEMIIPTWNPCSLWGGVIYKGDLFTEKEWDDLFGVYTENIHFVGLFDFFSTHKMNAVAIKTEFFKDNPFKQEAVWVLNGRILEAETDFIPKAADDLPPMFDSVKPKVRRLFADNGDTFTMKKSWYLRRYNNLNLEKVFKYRKKIKSITDTKWIWFLFVSLVPKKLALKLSSLFSES
nr:hypothetical protein [uncultured Anaerosporobacter sp.]